MKKLYYFITVMESAICGIRTYFASAMLLFSIGLLEVFDTYDKNFYDEQQDLFLAINVLVLTLLIIMTVMDFICSRKRKGIFFFVEWGTAFICCKVVKVYGISTQTPYSSLNTTTLLYFIFFLLLAHAILCRVSENLCRKVYCHTSAKASLPDQPSGTASCIQNNK